MTPIILLDTDVVVNWLAQETETVSGRELWKAPYEIVKHVENKSVSGLISLTTLMEIRFLLRDRGRDRGRCQLNQLMLKYRNAKTSETGCSRRSASCNGKRHRAEFDL